jgi:hypothetical protein
MDFSMDCFRRYSIESWKIVTGNATITDVFADEQILLVFVPRVDKYLLQMP